MSTKREFLTDLQRVLERYIAGDNVAALLSADGATDDPSAVIQVSYDLQAGTYTRFADEHSEYKRAQTEALAKVLAKTGTLTSVLEAGVGEATTLAPTIASMALRPNVALGFDLSWSRVRYAQSYCDRYHLPRIRLAVGDLFEMPLVDSSVDVVYTFHSIEPNGGREKEALRELHRVARRYVVLCEPSFELATSDARERMRSHGFAGDAYPAARELGLKVVEHRPFDVSFNPLNPTALTVIEKQPVADRGAPVGVNFACPITRTPLREQESCYFSDRSLLAYPIIGGVPCLLPAYAVVATHFADFDK